MSFEWQDRDAAARTLGVDTKTLQAWIDDGRAPSRTNGGRLQVLIEHLDEPAAAPDGDAETPATAKAKSNGQSHKNGTGGGLRHDDAQEKEAEPQPAAAHDNARAERVQAMTTDLELVSKRELQMAGGMVAAWQRLAETSNHDLARARKVGILSWSLVAAMVVIGGIGVWLSTHSVTDAQGRLLATQEKLSNAERAVTDTQTRAAALQTEVAQRMADLAEANAKLSATIERINLTKSQADQLAAQHLLTKQLADKQAETSKSLAETLQATINDQKQRLAALDKELANTKLTVAELQSNAAAMLKKDQELTASLQDMTKQRDEARTHLEQVKIDHAAAVKVIDDLKKEMASIKAEMERTKTAEK